VIARPKKNKKRLLTSRQQVRSRFRRWRRDRRQEIRLRIVLCLHAAHRSRGFFQGEGGDDVRSALRRYGSINLKSNFGLGLSRSVLTTRRVRPAVFSRLISDGIHRCCTKGVCRLNLPRHSRGKADLRLDRPNNGPHHCQHKPPPTEIRSTERGMLGILSHGRSSARCIRAHPSAIEPLGDLARIRRGPVVMPKPRGPLGRRGAHRIDAKHETDVPRPNAPHSAVVSMCRSYSGGRAGTGANFVSPARFAS